MADEAGGSNVTPFPRVRVDRQGKQVHLAKSDTLRSTGVVFRDIAGTLDRIAESLDGLIGVFGHERMRLAEQSERCQRVIADTREILSVIEAGDVTAMQALANRLRESLEADQVDVGP